MVVWVTCRIAIIIPSRGNWRGLLGFKGVFYLTTGSFVVNIHGAVGGCNRLEFLRARLLFDRRYTNKDGGTMPIDFLELFRIKLFPTTASPQ